jgi:hypothetical protein
MSSLSSPSLHHSDTHTQHTHSSPSRYLSFRSSLCIEYALPCGHCGRLFVARQQEMDLSPAYRQEHALLTVEELTIDNISNDGCDIMCSLHLRDGPPITVDYSMVSRVHYTWTSDVKVTVHHEWKLLTEALEKAQSPAIGDTLTQTPFDYLQHGGIQAPSIH